MFEDAPLQFPPMISHSKVAKIVAEHLKLRTDLAAEWERFHTLEQDRAKAEDADRQAYATAIRAGKGDDPGTEAADAVDKAITVSRRRKEALQVAVDESRRAVIQAVEQYRPEWQADLDAQAAEASAAFAEAVEALAAAHDRLAEATTVANWLRSWTPNSRLKPPVATGRVEALISRNGSGTTWPAVLDALRTHAKETTPTAPHLAGVTA